AATLTFKQGANSENVVGKKYGFDVGGAGKQFVETVGSGLERECCFALEAGATSQTEVADGTTVTLASSRGTIISGHGCGHETDTTITRTNQVFDHLIASAVIGKTHRAIDRRAIGVPGFDYRHIRSGQPGSCPRRMLQ